MNNTQWTGALSVVFCVALSGCDSDEDARELRNRVTVATQNYSQVEIRSRNTVLEAGRLYTLQLLAGNDEVTDDQTGNADWSVSDPNVLSVDPSSGLISALADGTATISSSFGSLSDSIELRVSSAPLEGIMLEPPATLDECNSVQLVASGLFPADDDSVRDITDTVTWAVGDASVGAFSGAAAGLFFSSNAGAAFITAGRDGISDEASITIEDTLDSITLTPVDPVVTTSTGTQFTATASYRDSDVIRDVSDNSTWSVSNTSVAQVDNALPDKGLLNASVNSNVELTVRCGGEEDTVDITIGNPSIATSIGFNRDSPWDFEFTNQAPIQLQAIATLQTGETVFITDDVDWDIISRTTNAITVNNSSNKGEVTVNGRGTATIRITYTGSAFDETNSTISPAFLEINVL
jgi:hypothetical protein